MTLSPAPGRLGHQLPSPLGVHIHFGGRGGLSPTLSQTFAELKFVSKILKKELAVFWDKQWAWVGGLGLSPQVLVCQSLHLSPLQQSTPGFTRYKQALALLWG